MDTLIYIAAFLIGLYSIVKIACKWLDRRYPGPADMEPLDWED